MTEAQLSMHEAFEHCPNHCNTNLTVKAISSFSSFGVLQFHRSCKSCNQLQYFWAYIKVIAHTVPESSNQAHRNMHPKHCEINWYLGRDSARVMPSCCAFKHREEENLSTSIVVCICVLIARKPGESCIPWARELPVLSCTKGPSNPGLDSDFVFYSSV